MVLTLVLKVDWPPQNEIEMLEIYYCNIKEGNKTFTMGLLERIYDI